MKIIKVRSNIRKILKIQSIFIFKSILGYVELEKSQARLGFQDIYNL